MKFLDQAKISLQSGRGGPGCVSFHREKFVEFGGPNGGNGGRGGDLYFLADDRMNTLIDFRYQQHFSAENGQNGMGRDRSGKGGEDCVIRVPVGTQILAEDQETILLDMMTAGEKVLFLRGGDGGFGNAHYKSSTNQAPRKSTPGWPGQEAEVWLRLKMIADVGLVGMPNAGKSTFLAACSNAKPKIADYPFTTLHPNLGVVKAGNTDFVMADIPGLIEGAHEGHGLGDRFLGHVERTAVLLHLIDCTQDDVFEAYSIIRNELKQYGQDIEYKKEIIVITKVDALGEELAEDVRQEFEAKLNKANKSVNKDVYMMSSVSRHGVDKILYKLAEVVREHKQMEARAAELLGGKFEEYDEDE
jgi:GTP-binding protein